MLDLFFNLDVRTLFMILFSGNLVSVGLICAFYWTAKTGRSWSSSRNLLLAKIFLAAGFFLMLLRDRIPPLFSVNLGNTLSLIGFYHEALAMSGILKETARAAVFLRRTLVVCLVGFNGFEFASHSPSLRVVCASLGIFLILFMPCLRLFISPNSSLFKRLVGVLYLCVLVVLIPRALYGLTSDVHVFSGGYIQTLTHLAMASQLVFSLPAFLLLTKEDTDQVIEGMATTDMLTGLPNRYSFLDAAQRVFTRGGMSGDSVAILFMDVDFFKNINDTYGHNFGDNVLVSFGRAIRGCLRPADLCCRYGGEEFVVLLHKAETDVAVLVAERIRDAASKLSFSESPGFRFTLSAGVAAGVPGGADNLDLFISRADAALYSAKRNGRNRVTTYRPRPPSGGNGAAGKSLSLRASTD